MSVIRKLLLYVCPIYLLEIYPRLRYLWRESIKRGGNSRMPEVLLTASAFCAEALLLYLAFRVGSDGRVFLWGGLIEILALTVLPFVLGFTYDANRVFLGLSSDLYALMGLTAAAMMGAGIIWNRKAKK